MEYPITSGGSMKRAAAVLIAILVAACSPAAKTETAKLSAEEYRAQLQRDLPTGSSVSEVEAYLKSNGYKHSGIIDNAELAHMGADPQTLEIKTIVRGVRKTLLVKTDISITFSFTREKKLANIAVEEVHTGL